KPKALEPVDLNSTVIGSLKILESAMPAELKVERRLSAGDLFVLADETQLKQVVMNLLLNARDAITGAGVVTITTARGEGTEGNGAVQEEKAGRGRGGWVHLSIGDTGRGMDESVGARLFEPFFSTKERGTGLGLTVVRHIVEELEGRIEVWS